MLKGLNDLRLIRDGLIKEKIHLLGVRAQRDMEGLGLFKSKRVKLQQIKLQKNETINQGLKIEADEVFDEINILGAEVQSLRQELGIREDEPLTRMEAHIQNSIGGKQVLQWAGVAALIILLIGLIKK